MLRGSLLLLITVVGCQPAATTTIPVSPTVTSTPQTVADVPVVGLELVGVLGYQGVEISLYDANGNVPDIQAPVLRNRDMMVRLMVNPASDWQERKVKAVLTVKNGQDEQELTQRLRVTGRSTRGDLESSINFDIPGTDIGPNTKLSVALFEAEPETEWTGEALNTTWSSGDLNTEKTDVVNLVLIPIRYNFDGSGRVPDTGEAQVARYRDLMLAMYPVEDVVVTVTDPYDWDYRIRAWDTNEWSNLLYTLSDERAAANVDANTYFYGLFNSTQSFTDFCQQGCILGLSNLAWNTNDPWYRTSIGIGFTGFNNTAATTLVHEVGHAHGRQHADCGGASGIDPQYPYEPNAIIGSWGYDNLNAELYAPESNHDMMGYCEPMWLSDYTYYNLYLQIISVGNVFRTDRIPYQTLRVDSEGGVRLDAVREFVPDLGGDPVKVLLVDVHDNVIDEVDGLFTGLSHGPGGMVMIAPIDDPRVVGARIPTL